MTVRTDRPAVGRPLDLALGQAMGWQIVVSPDGAVWTTGPIDAPIVAPDGPLVALPSWSTDEAAAWRLASDLRTRTGYEISLYSPDGSRTAWGAGVGRRGYWIEEIGATRAEALCRALLLYYAFGMPAAAWRIKLAVTALQVAVRAFFGLAVVVTVVNPASPAWLRAVAVLGWVAHVGAQDRRAALSEAGQAESRHLLVREAATLASIVSHRHVNVAACSGSTSPD